jgi:hypothetical protein
MLFCGDVLFCFVGEYCVRHLGFFLMIMMLGSFLTCKVYYYVV